MILGLPSAMHVFLIDSEYDVRRFAFATETPAFLLPLARRSLLERTVNALAPYRLGRPVLITARNAAEEPELAQAVARLDLRTAPSVAAALSRARDEGAAEGPILFVLANIHPLPDIAAVVAEHVQGRRTLTWVRGSSWGGPGQYTFGPPAVMVAAASYGRLLLQDEAVRPFADLPRIAKERGFAAGAVDASQAIIEINNPYALYHLNLDGLAAERADLFDEGFRPLRPNFWVHPSAKVGEIDFVPDGGLVVLGRNVRVEDGTLLCGPSVLGDGAVVGAGSAIHRGLVFASTWLPGESFVQRQIVSSRLTARVAA
jgi:hypothetical protein